MIGVITAREGSKGIKDKNIQKISKYTLLEWTIISAKKSNLEKIYLSTDSQKMMDIGKKHQINVINRPKELAQDNSSSIDVLKHVYNLLELTDSQKIMILQPTSPFRNSQHINECIYICEEGNYNSLMSIEMIEHLSPSRMVFVKENIITPYTNDPEEEHLPRQMTEKIYLRNGAIYITTVKNLKLNKIRDNNCYAYMMNSVDSVNIDMQSDFDYATYLACKYNKEPT